MRQVLTEGLALIVRFVRAHPVAFGLAVGGATAFAGAIVGAAVVVGRVTDDLIVPVLDGGVAVDGKWVGAVLAVVAVAAWKPSSRACR